MPVKCASCLPPNDTDLYEDKPPVSVAYVTDTGERGMTIFEALLNASNRVFPAFQRRFPNRISKYEIFKIGRSTGLFPHSVSAVV